MIRPRLTAEGKTIVERYGSSISGYENRAQTATSAQTVINIKGSTIAGQLVVGDNNRVSQKNGTGAAELADLVADVLEAARETAEEERVGRAMAQLQLEAEEDESDSTVIGKMLERIEEIAEDTISDALMTALKRLGA